MTLVAAGGPSWAHVGLKAHLGAVTPIRLHQPAARPLVSSCRLWGQNAGRGSDTPFSQPCSIPEAVLRPQFAAAAAGVARDAAAGGSRAGSLPQTLMPQGRPSQCPCPHQMSRASCTWVTPCLSHCRCVTKDLKNHPSVVLHIVLSLSRLEACAAALAQDNSSAVQLMLLLATLGPCSFTLNFLAAAP